MKTLLLTLLLLWPVTVFGQTMQVTPSTGPVGTPFAIMATFPSTMTDVEIVLDGSNPTSPHSVSWTPLAPGTYTASLVNAVTRTVYSPVSFTVTPGTYTPPAPVPNIDHAAIEAKLTEILTKVSKLVVGCSITGLGTYANGDQRLTVRCKVGSGFVAGPVILEKQ